MIITEKNSPMYKKSNGTYMMTRPETGNLDYWCGFPNDPDGCHAKVEAYIIAHPDALVPEPLPPPPTDAQLEATAESQRQARFAEYNTAIMRLKRAERMGDPTATASIAQWDEYAVALQALNDVPGWFRDTVWPVKPEA